jgi:hypothetical protein
MTQWQFSDPPNVAVIVNRKIVDGAGWIAFASHDAPDGGWQFHTNDPGGIKESDAAVVSLHNIVQADPSVVELADLPVGWHAWRDSKDASWQRAQTK